MDAFDILALNENYEIVAIINYTLLQWTRKYFESGTFSIQIPLETYSSEYKYIYTRNRPELGVIEQINFYIDSNFKSVTLSGYFLERELHKRIVYRNYAHSNIINPPVWNIASGKAEDVAFSFFADFKDLSYTQNGSTFTTNLGIDTGQSQHRGHHSEHTRGGEYLSNKIYSILKPSKLSYRVRYDFETSRKVFEVWSGVDRTQDNPELNNPVIFSTRYGNIINADILIASTDYCNSYVVNNGSSGDDTYIVVGNRYEDGETDARFFDMQSGEMPSDYPTEADLMATMANEGSAEQLKYQKTISLDFDTLEGSYEYLKDFDLGDQCSVEVPELELSVDAVLSGIYEVVKKGIWSMTLEFTTY